MKRIIPLPGLALGILLLTARAVGAPAAGELPESVKAVLGREESVLVTVTATVEAIDPVRREATLKGPLGNTVIFAVDPRVKRLEEVKVGDHVQADYYISVAGELRPPTPEEEKNPFVALGAVGKAPAGTSPAAGGLRAFRVVTTVEGLDRPSRTATLKGPRGNYLTVRVADPARLTQARIGDHVVVTYTEALAISLQKVPARTPAPSP